MISSVLCLSNLGQDGAPFGLIFAAGRGQEDKLLRVM